MSITWVCANCSKERTTKKNRPTKPCSCGCEDLWKLEFKERNEFNLVFSFPDETSVFIRNVTKVLEEKGGYPDFISIVSKGESQTYNTEF